MPKEKLDPNFALPELVLPEGPYIERDEKGVAKNCTVAGTEVIKRTSAEGCSQQHIASLLGVSHKTLVRLLGKADADPMPPERAAYETGKGILESELVRLLVHGARRGGMIQGLFLLKAKYNYRDQAAMTIDNSAKIEIVRLPDNMSREEYIKIHGDIIDTREPAAIRSHMLMQGKSESEIVTYLAKIGKAETMKVLNPPTPNQGG